MHKATHGHGRLRALAEYAQAIDDARGAELLEADPDVQQIRKAQLREIATARFRHQANGLQVADIGTDCLDKKTADRSVKVGVVNRVVHMPVMIIIVPAGGNFLPDAKVAACWHSGGSMLAHGGHFMLG